MTSLATAKVLFFIAMSLAPQGAHVFQATSNSENYVWNDSELGWSLKTKGMPNDDWTAQGVQPKPYDRQEAEFRAIAQHRWSEGEFLDLQDGTRVEKQGDAVFYIIDPGAPNQKVYTILYPQQKD